MSNENDYAVESADHLIELLIQHQPDLFNVPTGSVHKAAGEKVGDFIDGLRSRLIEMYSLNGRCE